MKVYWSDRLEDLAAKFYAQNESAEDPFARRCVIVDNPVRRDWLKRWFLLDRNSAAAERKILANLEFTTLYQFVNDFLFAASGKDSATRNPSFHPYSKDVMQFRINGILERNPEDFKFLTDYIGKESSMQERRRFALSGAIARLFDEYQSARPEMLKKWEHSIKSTDGWQENLWRKLKNQPNAGDSYLDWFMSLAENKTDLSAAFKHGIPHYRHVSVFGVSGMPRPYLTFFEKLDEIIPVGVFLFNPCREMWFDDPSPRLLRRELSASLANGDVPEEKAGEWVSAQTHPLLGLFASGAQGLLGDLVDECGADAGSWTEAEIGERADLLGMLQDRVRDRKTDAEKTPVRPEDDSIQIHSCHSLRREMETLKDGIYDWLSKRANGTAHPKSILVLCANYTDYAPYIESVFSNSGIPYVRAGRGIKDAGMLPDAFLRILNVSSTRVTVSWVTGLLDIPQIAAKFDLTQDEYSSIPDMIKSANIHWGFDDDDVREQLAKMDSSGTASGSFPFTWERGLNRLALGVLGAAGKEKESGLINGKDLGYILPGENVPDGKTNVVAGLCRFIDDLRSLSRQLKKPRNADEWEKMMFRILHGFFAEDSADDAVFKGISKAISAFASRMAEAGKSGGEPELRLGADAVATAMKAIFESVSFVPRETADDAVTFAPLKLGSAFPADMVCVCGLNTGVFPRRDDRPAFDLIGKRMTLWDRSNRREDLLAFLEAAMSARETLRLSYIGRDITDNSDIPPSIALAEFSDYVNASFSGSGSKPVLTPVRHKLQPFSIDYFLPEKDKSDSRLKSWSETDQKIAAALTLRSDDEKSGQMPGEGFSLFSPDKDADVPVELLAEYFSNPYGCIFRNILAAQTPYVKDNGPADDESLEDALPGDEKRAICLNQIIAGSEDKFHAIRLVETGCLSSEDKYDNLAEKTHDDSEEFRTRPLYDNKTDITACKAIVDQERADRKVKNIVIKVRGKTRAATVRASIPFVEYTDAAGKPVKFSIHTFDGKSLYFNKKILPWLMHLCANADGMNLWTVLIQVGEDSPFFSFAPMERDIALKTLSDIAANLAYEKFVPAIPFFPDENLTKCLFANPFDKDEFDKEWNSLTESPFMSEIRGFWKNTPDQKTIDAPDSGILAVARRFWNGCLTANIGKRTGAILITGGICAPGRKKKKNAGGQDRGGKC